MALAPALARVARSVWRSREADVPRRIVGHAWTFGSMADERFVRVRPPPPSERWTTELDDPVVGPVVLSARWRRTGASTLVVIVHGLGGDADSYYTRRAARAVDTAGFDALRLNLRGADREGWDFYHAGLTADLHATLASPALAPYRDVVLLGYSLGGHLALRFAAEAVDPRVRAVIAVCAPVDLARARLDLDRPTARPYRRYVLASLHAMARANATRGRLPGPLADILAVRTANDWFERVVGPRFGYPSIEAFVRAASVHHHLDRLAIPSLLVTARHDPMVHAPSNAAALPARHPHLTRVEVERAGHLGFPADLDLGFDPTAGLEAQALGWARRHL